MDALGRLAIQTNFGAADWAIVVGARDVLALLRSLKSHHAEQVQPDSNDA